MILQVQQINKEPYAAEFVLKQQNEEVGSIFCKGDIRTVWVETTIDFFGHLYSLSHNGVRGIFKRPIGKEYRIFNTFVDDIQTGYICGDEKENILNVYNDKRNYPVSLVSCKGDGFLYPVYHQDKQIALIVQEENTENNWFNFVLHTQEDTDMSLLLLIMGYIYTCFCYRTGPLEMNNMGSTSISNDPRFLATLTPQSNYAS
jgi:hypothetical protein